MINKIAIIGFGSAGQRHFKALKKIKNFKIFIFSKRKNKRNNFYPLSLIETINPDYIIISSATSDHKKHIKLIEKKFIKKIVLVEKPLLEKFSNLNLKRNTYYVGYQLRFHPVLQKLKGLIKRKVKVFNINIISNSYLPKWRKRDYRTSYSSSKSQGGGVLLDLSHELDYLTWIFPNIKFTYLFKKKISSLSINTDDICIINGVDRNKKFHFQINLNYFSKIAKRSIHVDAEKFSFTGDLLKNNYQISFFGRTKTERFKKINNLYLTYLMHKSILESKRNNLSDHRSGLELLKKIYKLNKINF